MTQVRCISRNILSKNLICNDHALPLTIEGAELHCPTCGLRARHSNAVYDFLEVDDKLYEGKYDNRVKFIPRGDGFIATLPFRIVQQGYPNIIADKIPPGSIVLDIGSAGGSDWFASRFTMIGIDVSMYSLRSLSDRYDLAVRASAVSIPLADGTCDGVISSCVFEHFTPADKAKVLAECFRILRPGGRLIFFYDLLTSNSLIARYRDVDPERYKVLFLDGDGHVGYESVAQNRSHFTEAGFDIEDERFHERTPLLSNSVWQKLAQWPGRFGSVARVGKALTSGPLRIPAMAMSVLADVTFGSLVPPDDARCVTTVARKR